MNIIFALIDLRMNVPAAQEANEKLFADGGVFGIEVTIPQYAERCYKNLDPQHLGGDADTAAIELAVTCDLPEPGSTLATVRADLDSVGSMAILAMRAEGMDLTTEVLDRVQKIAESDKFARGGWPGKRPLPTRESLFDSELDGELAAIGAAVSDFKVTLEQRVAWMREWLVSGAEPDGYRDRIKAEKMDMIQALESGQIQISSAADGKIAVVVSTHRAGTSLGYMFAPVVVATNPAFSFAGGEPHIKHTICVFEAGKYADLKAALTELNGLEPGWGGSPTIGGSPQGASSQLTTDQVAAVIAKHLL